MISLTNFGRRSVVASLGVVVVAGGLTARLIEPGEARWDCHGRSMTAAEIATERGVPVDKLAILEDRRDLTPRDICVMPEAKLQRALVKVGQPKPDHPGEAMAWRALRQKDENGHIPLDGATRALEHAAAMPPPAVPARASAGGDQSDQIAANSWTSLGPGNIGGRVRSLAFDPSNSQKIWAGSVAGGLWKTTNGGTSWTSVSSFLANMSVSSIVISKANPLIMYAGTGEGFYNGDGLRGAGILKSANGGTSWARLASTNTSDFEYVNRVALSPNGSTVLAATRTGLFRSTDGGGSWSMVKAGEFLDVRWHPTSNTAAIAGGRNAKIWRTNTGGQTWIAAAGLPAMNDSFGGRVELAYAESSPSTIYASIDTSKYDFGTNGSAIYRSTDGGATFAKRIDTTNYLSTQGWYDNALWVSPKNPNLVIVGGLDLWRSTNGGSTLTKISQWWSAPVSSAHADHHVIVSPPDYNGTTNKAVYFGNDGGVYKAANVDTVALTSGWTELNNTFGVTQFYSAAINPTTKEIIGGTQDNGTLFYKPTTGAQQWTTAYGGDGGFSAADPTDPNYYYGEYVYLMIHRSTNRGVSSNDIWSGIGDADSCANFIAPFILDPNLSTRMLAGGCSLWRSNNVKAATPTWSSIKPSIGSPISAIAVAPGNSDMIWVGHNNGAVYKTVNGTAASPTWTLANTGLPARYVNRITVSKANRNHVYVSFGGYSAQNVWKTGNAGASWAARSGAGASGLPAVPVNSLVIQPNNPTWLYVGTDIGVHYSTDDGVNWHNNTSGPSATAVDELFFDGTVLYAATHGRGIYKSNTQ